MAWGLLVGWWARVGRMADERRDNPVVLSRIYTRTGDDGSTALVDGSRVAKTDSRLQAYADTDEANCAIGMAVTFGQLPSAMSSLLGRIQNELFDVGADLANPVSAAPPPYPQLRRCRNIQRNLGPSPERECR